MKLGDHSAHLPPGQAGTGASVNMTRFRLSADLALSASQHVRNVQT